MFYDLDFEAPLYRKTQSAHLLEILYLADGTINESDGSTSDELLSWVEERPCRPNLGTFRLMYVFVYS